MSLITSVAPCFCRRAPCSRPQWLPPEKPIAVMRLTLIWPQTPRCWSTTLPTTSATSSTRSHRSNSTARLRSISAMCFLRHKQSCRRCASWATARSSIIVVGVVDARHPVARSLCLGQVRRSSASPTRSPERWGHTASESTRSRPAPCSSSASCGFRPQAGELSWFSCSPTLPKLLFGRRGRCSGSHRRRAHRARGPLPPFAACLRLSVSAWALPMSPAPLRTSGPPKSGQATAVWD